MELRQEPGQEPDSNTVSERTEELPDATAEPKEQRATEAETINNAKPSQAADAAIVLIKRSGLTLRW